MISAATSQPSGRAAMPVLVALGLCHLLNDLIQSMIPALYPVLKDAYRLDFAQVGLITLAFQVTSSLLQPIVGHVTDRRPWPYAMVAGMGSTLVGLLGLAFASSYGAVLVSAALVGLGSAVFHPEATRMARHAAGGRQGLAQGVFQVGGHVGYAIGPLLAAAVVVPRGQTSLASVSVVALVAMAVMAWVGTRYASLRREQSAAERGGARPARPPLAPAATGAALALLILLMMSKHAYSSSFTSFYTFFLIERFGVSVQTSQVLLFLYLVVSALAVVVGGMAGDRFGRRRVIWFSILGVLPFSLLLPHVDLFWTAVLSVVISLIMASAFSAILVYAIDLMPHRIGLVGGLFYGLAFGLGGVSAALLGVLADRVGVQAVFGYCAWLPAMGLIAWWLPNIEPPTPERRPASPPLPSAPGATA